jgi:hypothetical protein
VGAIRTPIPVKLIAPMLAADPASFQPAQEALEERFGPLDFVSNDLPFTFTRYYAEELGEHLLRRFVSVRDLIDPGELAGIKLWSNTLEDSLRRAGKRTVNVDPGYVCGGKLVLATTKDQAHRIYLCDGIYAEATLLYRAGKFVPQPWTYPDYASEPYHRILMDIRTRYMAQLRAAER